METVGVVAQYNCQCGEGPLFDPRRNVVFWTDIAAESRMFGFEVARGQHRQIYTGQTVGGFTLQEDGALLLFRATDIALFDPDTGALRVVREFADPGIPRFNDTSAGPDGACYAGTMGKTNTSGGLFRLSTDTQLTELFRGTGCANGMGWSPDRRTMYWTCSSRNIINAYDYDIATGKMSNERLFHKAIDRATEGTCDGLAVDSAGIVHSARWGGGAIYSYTPDGRFLRKLDLPARYITSLCYAGPDLRDVFVTTAKQDDASPAAGALLRFHADTPGQLDFHSRIKV
jgi:D-xylono/L-arabinono-1,4-lactonase